MRKPTPLDFSRIKTYSLRGRPSKVTIDAHFARPVAAGMSGAELLAALPEQLGSAQLLAVAAAIVSARRQNKPVVLAIGGHVVKCGLQPVIKGLLQAGAITAVAMNGSAAIHDYEISLVGATSEDVGAVLHAGDFGFSEETGAGMNRALKDGMARDIGFGEAIAQAIVANRHPHRQFSLLAACQEFDVPATVHVALGTDIIHQHPQADGAVLGEMSMRDFRLLTAIVATLGDGGVWLNVGSAVLLPEVFLKALSVAQNLGHHVDHFTTANFDMIQHYRPLQNVVKRPTSGAGRGYSITGHHEINLPLLALAVLNGLAETRT
jgi:hypothetical protein